MPRSNVGPTRARTSAAAPEAQSAASATWQPVGPDAVLTPNFGLVTGRVAALALDPSDPTGNHLYVGTTGGGVWVAQNAAVSNASLVVFTPLTDAVEALNLAVDASISIGALTVQPGGTGVILAGTGDPNDALDSYYGAGILRSADGGNSWSLIYETCDHKWEFAGEGFAGFAWSTVNPTVNPCSTVNTQLVVAAVSQAYEDTLVNVNLTNNNYMGLYYSADGGLTWSLATITDGPGEDVQGPDDAYDKPNGNAATAVVWNKARGVFIAAVRFHGYYESADGITWTRMAAQPGAGLTTAACPTNQGQTGSIDCPIFRGSLAVNPETGDTFAWTVDDYNQDQGLWQDQCAIINPGAATASCANQPITFAQQWNTAALETNTANGAATIQNGDYNLALAAVPSGQETLLLAGANDLWETTCPVSQGCVWRNTTNSTTCMSAGVAEFQHALAWNTANPLEILVGNDGGLWRSLDAIGETGPVCAGTDSTHFQNLNGGLGSLAEVVSLASSGTSQYVMMTGLGVNGTAGMKSGSIPVADWAQILSGYGGPVAIDPRNTANWYVNSQDGVSIYLCSDPSACTPADFGTTPVVDDADVGGDGDTMGSPAPFLVDPLDPTQLLIGTCRVWRGPASGAGWSGSNAISPILDSGATNVSCSGDALIRSMAALPLGNGDEVVYVGMYGVNNGGANLPGHIWTATIDPQSTAMPAWTDLTLNPVTNSVIPLNKYGLDVSSIFIDSHDATGKTVYVTVAGFSSTTEPVQTVYGSTDGGTQWEGFMANLPGVPASSLVVDPQSANTAYLATDVGVYFTTDLSSCANLPLSCWSVFGSGLPGAPVVELSAAPPSAAAPVLTAATYGRGVWQTPLCSASGAGQTSASTSAAQLAFGRQAVGTAGSPPLPVTVTNTGSVALTVTAINFTDSVDFSKTEDCTTGSVAAGSSCTISVTFDPQAAGSLASDMAILGNVCGGQLTVGLTGTGTSTSAVTLSPTTLPFPNTTLGTPNPPKLSVGVNTPVAIGSVSITQSSPFTIVSNTCVAGMALPGTCQVTVQFLPTTRGLASGTLTFSDADGTQTAILTGTGQAPATGILNTTSVSFPATAVGQSSASLAAPTMSLSNTGDLPLECIVVWAGAAPATTPSCDPIPSTGDFAATNTCNGQLAGPGTCSISVVFTPTAVGPRTGTLWVYDALGTQQVALSGTGVQPATLSVSSSSPDFANDSLTFPNQNLNVASAPQTLKITNTGEVAAGVVGFTIPGSSIPGSPASYFATGTTTCTAPLGPGSSCTVQVIFTPGAAGGSAASLNIAAAGAQPVTVALAGDGYAPSGLNVSPAQLTFAATVVGAPSAAQTVTISNTASVAASPLTLALADGAASAGFALTPGNCTAALGADASCTVRVVFAPTALGPVTGALNVSSPTISNTANVLLGGTGAVPGAVQVTPSPIDFPTTGVGQTSSPATVTVTNTGIVTTLSNLALAVPAGFLLVNNTCAGIRLGPSTPGSSNNSCTAGVEFAPIVAGAQTGILTVSSTTLPAAASVPLQGMGFDFTVTWSGSSAQSVASGQFALYTLVLTPLNGSSGAFTFACGALPTNALCTFSPATEMLNSGVTGNVTVQVATGGSTSTARLKGPGAWSILPLVCGLLLLPLGWNRRRRKAFHGTVLLMLLAILAGGIASCATSGGGTGGGDGSGGAGSTPAGTYSVPVTVTSTGVSHSATLTLTVD